MHSGSQDEEIVMLNNSFCLALWRLPAASAALPSAAASASAAFSSSAERPSHQAAIAETAVCDSDDAVLLAFTHTRYRVYSIARSPNGKFIAVGEFASLTFCHVG